MISLDIVTIGVAVFLAILLGYISLALTCEILQQYQVRRGSGGDEAVKYDRSASAAGGKMRDARSLTLVVVAGALMSLATFDVATAQEETARRLQLDSIAQRLQLGDEARHQLEPHLERFNELLQRRWEHWQEASQLREDLSEAYQTIATTLTAAQLREFHWVLRDAGFVPGFGQQYGRMMIAGMRGFVGRGGPWRGIRADFVWGVPWRGVLGDSVWGTPWRGVWGDSDWGRARWAVRGSGGWGTPRRGMWGGPGWGTPRRGFNGGWGRDMGGRALLPSWRPDDGDPGV